MDRKPFEEIARPFCMVDAVQHYTSGEHTRAHELYQVAVKVDLKMAEARERERQSLADKAREPYRTAREDQSYWYDEGRDAVTEFRALANNAAARAAGHPRAAR